MPISHYDDILLIFASFYADKNATSCGWEQTLGQDLDFESIQDFSNARSVHVKTNYEISVSASLTDSLSHPAFLVLVAPAATSIRLPRQLRLARLVRRRQRRRLTHPTHQVLRKPFQVPLRDTRGVNLVQPIRQSVPTFCDLQLNGRDNAVVVRRVQVAFLKCCDAVWHDDRAD